MEKQYPARSGTHNRNMFFIYILHSERTGQHYIGSTNDVSRRLNEHNDTERKSWASRRGPWKLVYTEDFDTRSEAMKVEKYLKTLKSRERLDNYIAGWRSSISGGS